MKIDKTNPRHWLCLVAFGINVVVAMLLRPVWRRRGARRQVVMYGHKLSGNLLALHLYWRAHARADLDIVFLTMDKAYLQRLLLDGVASVLATRPSAIGLLARADAVVSDHGLHAMALMVGYGRLKFFDAWHGIPYKGFDARDFRLQRRYDETWVASPLLARVYVERFGFDADKVKTTGYARTDRLLRPDGEREVARRQLGLDAAGAGTLVLFAPTWQHDEGGRSMYPFGLDADAFLAALSEFAQRSASTVVLRAHLNERRTGAPHYPRIRALPFAAQPDTEAVLLASDVLVCDWSSIAFDWLLLDRPTVFLDVPPPFAKGFSLGPEYRFGALAQDLPDLLGELHDAVCEPDAFRQRYAAHRESVRREVYDECADGHAAERCLQRLR